MNLRLKQWIDGSIGRILVAIFVVIVRGLGLLLKRNHSLQPEPKNILVIKMLGLGSVFMAMDSLYSLKKRYPNTRFILMCGQGVAAGIEPLKFFDEIWVHNDKSIGKLVSSGFALLIKTWKQKGLWVMDLEVYSVLTTLFSAWTSARNRFGFQLNKVHFRNYLNTHNIYFNQFITVSRNYENLVKDMGVREIETFQTPQFSNQKKGNYIAINNTCSELGGDLRKMDSGQLKAIVNELVNQQKLQVAFTGAPSDYESLEKLIKNELAEFEGKVINIAGKFSFTNYYSFLSESCLAMISIDSAPLHIAMKLGLPTLSVWGPIKPEQRIETNQSKHLVVYKAQACSPCIHLSDIVPCGGNNICMKEIPTELLIQKTRELCGIVTSLH
ncbi:MAG: glycosyltransferase family 9 protein [Bacteroidia bacterium]|nr:glycosyltransferase family 9 protein [Bacteroidia bacterium]